MEKIFLNKRLVVIAFFTVFSTSTALAAGSGEGYDEVPVEMGVHPLDRQQRVHSEPAVAADEEDGRRRARVCRLTPG